MAGTGNRISQLSAWLRLGRRYLIANKFMQRAETTLVGGRPANVEADARSIMAAYADAAPAGEPYATARQYLTFAIGHLGRHSEAVREATELLDAIIPSRGDRNQKVISLRINRAGNLCYLAEYDRAEADSQAAIEDSRHLWPHSAEARFSVMAAGCQVSVLNGRGLHAKAEALARETLRYADSTDVHAGILVQQRAKLADSLNGQQRYAEVEQLLQNLRPGQPLRTVAVQRCLAAAQLGLGKLTEAETTARAAVSGGSQFMSPVHFETLAAGMLLGSALARQGKLAEAECQLRQNAADWAEHFGDEHPHTIAAQAELAKINR